MPAYFYAKIHHAVLNDPTWGMLPDTIWRKRIELEILANETPENDEGVLPPLSVICWRLHITKEQCEKLLNELCALNIVTKRYNKCNESLHYNGNDAVTWLLTDFHERQRAATNTERQTHFRARKAKNSNDSLQDSNDSVTNRYHSLNYNISNISEKDFENLWKELFSTTDEKFKNALKRDYKGSDLCARMRQWAEAKAAGLVELNDKQLYKRLEHDNPPPEPEPEHEPLVQVREPVPEMTAEEQAHELYRHVVTSPLLKHRPQTIFNALRPVSVNGKLILEYQPGIIPDKHLKSLFTEIETACYVVAGIGIELSETTEEAE